MRFNFGRATRDMPRAIYLLAHGALAREPGCAGCGRAFVAPRTFGARFSGSIAFLPNRESDSDHTTAVRLFVGATLLVARANRSMIAKMATEDLYLGERVLVASVVASQADEFPLIFCADCGARIAEKTTELGSDRYNWDRTAELHERNRRVNRVCERALSILNRKANSDAPDLPPDRISQEADASCSILRDPRVRAVLLARDLLLSGGCSMREMKLKALRVAAPLNDVMAMLEAFGASIVQGTDRIETIVAPANFPSTVEVDEIEFPEREATSRSGQWNRVVPRAAGLG